MEWLDSLQLRKEYGVLSPGAIRSKLGASIDPYLLTYRIFDYLQSQGICIFEETTIKTFNTDNTVILTTKNGNTVTAKHLIFATGYETQNYLKEKIVNLKSTYAFITKPLLESKLWKDRALLWDTGDPYLYVRLTPDNRILIGGADLVFRNSWLRDILIARRTKSVVKQFNERIPEMQFEIDRRWSGTFGETKDGLGYIGSSPEWKNTSFALGFGGNGITYSAIAGDMLIKQYQGKEVPDLELFSFGR